MIFWNFTFSANLGELWPLLCVAGSPIPHYSQSVSFRSKLHNDTKHVMLYIYQERLTTENLLESHSIRRCEAMGTTQMFCVEKIEIELQELMSLLSESTFVKIFEKRLVIGGYRFKTQTEFWLVFHLSHKVQGISNFRETDIEKTDLVRCACIRTSRKLTHTVMLKINEMLL